MLAPFDGSSDTRFDNIEGQQNDAILTEQKATRTRRITYIILYFVLSLALMISNKAILQMVRRLKRSRTQNLTF